MLPAKLVLLTTRYSVNLNSMERMALFPKPLDSTTLLSFITSLLGELPVELKNVNTMEFQLDLGIRIARIMTTGRVPYVRVGRAIRFRPETVEEILNCGGSLNMMC